MRSRLWCRARRATAVAIFAATVAMTAAARSRGAGAEEVPPARQVLILTRVLAYDGNLKSRAGTDLLIAVLGKPGNTVSDELASTMSKAFRGLGNVKVQGLPIRATQIAYAGVAALTSAIESQGIDALYVCPALEGDLPAIAEATRKLKVVTLASRESYVARGLSLGVFSVEGKPTIVVNLPASKAEGAAFGSDLLRLAKVIR